MFEFVVNFALMNLTLVTFALAFLLLIYNSITVARGDEIVTLERRWFGRQMPDGRTVALSNEVGVQARVLGPGVHLLSPFLYKTSKR